MACLLLAAVACRPASAQYHVFWGDVHGHTSHSDGKGSLDDYFTYARDVSKLDFVIVTDHDFGNVAPWRMPKDTWTLTQNMADKYTVDGSFVAIAGYEWTSQPKYWTEVGKDAASERLFPGPPKFYNHKNVYLPGRIEYLVSAKDPASMSPNLLATAVLKHGGLIQNNHPTAGSEGADQWGYDPTYCSVITNTEIDADTLLYEGKTYEVGVERTVRGFLSRGGKTGFVKGTDTHEGKPAARTAVLAKELTREAIFDALRHRRNYAVTNARIVLSFKIDGHEMGEEIETAGRPKIDVDIHGTDTISEVAIVRDGAVLHSLSPGTEQVKFTYVDESFQQNGYYYLRVTQVDKDKHGDLSRAWSSPIWVKSKVSRRSSPSSIGHRQE
ncbi:MAG: CehA/McbA family metallohydrolase [Planctomycetia bacterium]|nr:CehA/McbA family metallohydrolase [Planctomycetia bacterium]